jgi:hypothetical protein
LIRYPDKRILLSVILALGLITVSHRAFAQNEGHRDSLLNAPAVRPVQRDTVPKPRSVLLKSVIIPGWGQIVNKQIWKVPLIYGALFGLSYYSTVLTKDYHDFRAAYYNSLSDPTRNYHTDQRYGQTPAYLQGQSQQALKYYRNYYRNTRDMVYIGVGLAYGLNILDAYIFAQLKDFNVSDDLSVHTTVGPQNAGPYQGVGLKLTFRLKSAR